MDRNLIRRALRTLACTAGCAALLAGAGDARAATTIDTTPSWNGVHHVFTFGTAAAENTPTYGQVVTVPAGETALQRFSFRLDGDAGLTVRGQVYAWNGTRATGPALYSSAPRALAGGGFETVAFETGGVPVTPGQQIVLLATTLLDASSGSAVWGAILGGDVLPGGTYVYDNTDDVADLNTQDWDGLDGGYAGAGADLAMTAEFGGGVPVPAAARPVVTGVSARSGAIGGGETITVTGESFSDGTGVLFGDVPSSAVTVESATRLTVVTPPHEAGDTTLTVVNAGGRSDPVPFTFVAPVVQAPSSNPPADPCAVPALKGLALPKARRGLASAHCRLGTVTVTGKRGRRVVVAQSQPAGTILAAGTAVDVTVKRTRR
ncbi:MAG TPA: IPT/TIG domain-containing protein [Capillimicrobium sp.]|nr:IPT/TIG domain-containing protein [Capillimicrobium sp.]